jgi:hypothetical protein
MSIFGVDWYRIRAWVLAWVIQRVSGFQRDEVYIGTAEERAANNHADDDQKILVWDTRKLPALLRMHPVAAKAHEE